jgi:Family of unknown function (DUF6338)
MDLFFLQLIIIFVPGIIWERIDSQYGREHAAQQWDILRRTFVFGLSAYLVTFALLWIVSLRYEGWGFTLFQFKKDATFLDATAFREIAITSIVAFVCAILWLYVTNYKLITWLLQKSGATKRYGDEDVWEYMFNSGRAEVEYVHVRDFDKKLTYAGWVEVWSESEKQRELVLRDVIVYDLESVELYKTPRLYLARKADNIDIEFPFRPSGTAEPDASTGEPEDGQAGRPVGAGEPDDR